MPLRFLLTIPIGIKGSAVSLFDYYYSGVWDYNTQVYKAQRAACDDAKQSSASDAIC